MRCLNLGCGAELIERRGWVNADLEPRAPGVVPADAYALPFAKGEFDLVVTSHVLEHLDTPRALAEQRRVLKPGGEVLACIPDKAHAKEWMPFHLAELSARGGGGHHAHISDMTQGELEAALRAAGFVDVRPVNPLDRWELPGKAWWQAAARGRKEVVACA